MLDVENGRKKSVKRQKKEKNGRKRRRCPHYENV